jgi:hypothetical protein
VRTGREQLGPEMLADLEVVLRNDGERQHLYATHKRTHDGLPLGILERFVFCLTGSVCVHSGLGVVRSTSCGYLRWRTQNATGSSRRCITSVVFEPQAQHDSSVIQITLTDMCP